MVQTQISDVAKKMRMSSNLAKRKRKEEEPAHWEDEWEGELYSNSSNYNVTWNLYSNGEVATFGIQLPVNTVLHGHLGFYLVISEAMYTVQDPYLLS